MKTRMLCYAVLLSTLACSGDRSMEPAPQFNTSGAQAIVSGGGEFLLGGVQPFDFSVSGVQNADGSASGEFRFSANIPPFSYDFHAEVTCLAVDRVNHRAWIGGVITANRSTDPDLQLEIHQPGHDVWFRVVDIGEGSAVPNDRMTFIGFEGTAGIGTSEEYCQLQIWPNNGQTLTKGNIQVR